MFIDSIDPVESKHFNQLKQKIKKATSTTKQLYTMATKMKIKNRKLATAMLEMEIQILVISLFKILDF